MLKNIQHGEEESKTTSQQPWKYCLQPKAQARDKFKDKENSNNFQLKSSIHLQHKKVEYNGISPRETFAVYSKVHFYCLTKFHTLFLAFHLYELAIANHSLKNIPHAYKSLCCMFLAMKYEEIYPVQLAELSKCMKITFNLDDYRRHQRAILMSVGLDLDVQTIDRALEGYFNESEYDKIEEMKCFYLLELTFVSSKLYKKFQQSEILKAITKLVKHQGLADCVSQKEEITIDQIIRLTLEAKMNDKGIERQIQRKYQDEKYESVAIIPV